MDEPNHGTIAPFIIKKYRYRVAWCLGSAPTTWLLLYLYQQKFINKFVPWKLCKWETTRYHSHVVSAATFAPKTVFGNSVFYKLLE
jgi:hypothetical protein